MRTTLLFMALSILSYGQITFNANWKAFTPDGDLTKYQLKFEFNDLESSLDDTISILYDWTPVYRNKIGLLNNGIGDILQLYFDQNSGDLCYDSLSLEQYYLEFEHNDSIMTSKQAGFPSKCKEIDSIMTKFIWVIREWNVPDSIFKPIEEPIDTSSNGDTTGLFDVSRSELSVYPNPSNGVVNIDGVTEYSVINLMTGVRFRSTDNQIVLPVGYYMIEAETDRKKLIVSK